MEPRISCGVCGTGYSLGEQRPIDFKIKRLADGRIATFCQHCAPVDFLGGKKRAK